MFYLMLMLFGVGFFVFTKEVFDNWMTVKDQRRRPFTVAILFLMLFYIILAIN